MRKNPFKEVGTPNSNGVYVNILDITCIRFDLREPWYTTIFFKDSTTLTCDREEYEELQNYIDQYYGELGGRDGEYEDEKSQ